MTRPVPCPGHPAQPQMTTDPAGCPARVWWGSLCVRVWISLPACCDLGLAAVHLSWLHLEQYPTRSQTGIYLVINSPYSTRKILSFAVEHINQLLLPQDHEPGVKCHGETRTRALAHREKALNVYKGEVSAVPHCLQLHKGCPQRGTSRPSGTEKQG